MRAGKREGNRREGTRMNHFDSNASSEGQEPAGRALMTDLAEALGGPDAEAVATEVMARFQAADARLAAAMEKGTSPAQFASISAIRKGLQHAGQVLQAAVIRPGAEGHQAEGDR
jgi:hypothetical protein